MFIVACELNTTGYCEGIESGSNIRESAQGGTLEDSGWYFRV